MNRAYQDGIFTGTGLKEKWNRLAKRNEFLVFLILAAVMTGFTILNPNFLTTRNMFDLFRSMIVTGIFSCGVMMVMISGGVDISFMVIALCSSYLTLKIALATSADWMILPLILLSAVFGTILGLCNAVLINKFEIPVFITTLAVGTTIRGLMLKFVGNEYIPNNWMPPSTINFSRFYIFNTVDSTGASYGLHFSVLIMIGLMLLTHFIMRYMIVGRGVYAIGNDAVSAKRLGYNVSLVRCFLYCYAGAMAGIGGLIYAANNRMADPMSFQGEEMTVIAAVVLGGTSIMGGKGNMFGVFLGLMLTNVINNNLVMIGVPSYWQKLVFGILIIVAVFVQSVKAKRDARV
jgi:simple sugar transport system permease protein